MASSALSARARIISSTPTELPSVQTQGRKVGKIHALELAKARKVIMEKQEEERRAHKEKVKALIEKRKKEKEEEKKKANAQAKLVKPKRCVVKKAIVEPKEVILPVIETSTPSQIDSDSDSDSSQETTDLETLRCTAKDKTFGFSDGFQAKYLLLDKIGKGSFGTVFKAQRKMRTVSSADPFVAVKIIKKSELQTVKLVENVKREVEMMERLNGQENIIQFYGAYEDAETVYIVMELCYGPDLYATFKSRCRTFTEDEKRSIMHQILKAVDICHKNNVVHCDLKFENFMFASKDDYESMKLLDFGLSRMPGDKLTGIVGTLGHIAPEVFYGKFGFESDSFSIGCIAYMLYGRRYPFSIPEDPSDMKSWIPDFSKGGPRFSKSKWPEAAIDFVKRLLHPDPKKRMSVADALGHEYITGKTTTSVEIVRPALSPLREQLTSLEENWNRLKNQVAPVVALLPTGDHTELATPGLVDCSHSPHLYPPEVVRGWILYTTTSRTTNRVCSNASSSSNDDPDMLGESTLQSR